MTGRILPPPRSSRSLTWTTLVGGLALLLLVVDRLTGPLVRVSILSVIPVALAAWRWRGPVWLALACLFVAGRLWIVASSRLPWLIGPELANSVLMLGGYTAAAVLVRQAWRRARHAWGPPLPVCGGCGRVRSEGQWVRFERFVVEESGGSFRHTACPACERRVSPASVEASGTQPVSTT